MHRWLREHGLLVRYQARSAALGILVRSKSETGRVSVVIARWMDDASATVFVVDDDSGVRHSLAELLQSAGIFVRTCSSAAAFLAEYRSDQPGCLVCDVQLPDLSGLDLYERLIATGPQIPVIFMTAHADVSMAVRALKSGAAEFVEKPFNAQTMLERIQRALAEDRQRCEDAAHWQDVGTRLESLTDKEREVLTMLLDGTPNKAIAAKTEITERAVEMRRASIMRKLQVHSPAELIRLVTQFEMVSDRRTRRRWS